MTIAATLAAPLKPAALPLDEAARAALDDEASLQACTRWSTGPDGLRRAETRFELGGLDCAACAGLIESALLAVPGVEAATVQGSAERATVRWRPDAVRASALVEAVRAAGYRAHPAQGEAAAEARRREGRQALWRLFVAGFCMMQVMMVATPSYLSAPGELAPDLEQLLRWAGWVMSLPVLLFAAGPFVRGALAGLRQGRVVMDLPVALGVLITFLASSAATFDPCPPGPGGDLGGEVWFDSMTMFVAFLLAGRGLEARARERVGRALDSLLRELPDSVERRDDAGRWEAVAVARLRPGDRVRLRPGQAVPADGVVEAGEGRLDEALLSGESRPQTRRPGEPLVAGSLNLDAALEMRVLALGAATRRGQLLALMDQARAQRPAWLRTADRWAGPFLVAVLLLAAGAALAWQAIDPARATWVAVAVLIVSCPCAFSLAAPATLLAAAGGLARRGVLVQRLDAVEALARVDHACLDKTGTLGEDRPALLAWSGGPADAAGQARWRARAAGLAAASSHPLARALVEAAGDAVEEGAWTARLEHPGRGLEGVDQAGRRWRLGAPAWVGVAPGAPAPSPGLAFAPVEPEAPVPPLQASFDERPRPGARPLLDALRADGLGVEILSGDRPEAVAAFAARLHAADPPAALGGASPEAKLARLQALQAGGRRVLMVGDGLNDGPVLAQADVSAALGHGAALSQQRADLVVLGSRLEALVEARRIARRALAIVRQNLAWAAAYNLVAVPLALAGLLPPWAAGLGMALSSLLVVGNALRAGR